MNALRCGGAGKRFPDTVVLLIVRGMLDRGQIAVVLTTEEVQRVSRAAGLSTAPR
jgi:hypothetical protein